LSGSPFARAARPIVRLNVCRVFDICQAGDDSFLAMEYVNGEELGSLLRRVGRLPAEKG
jgi:serine/threonine protein kinase